MDQSKDEATPDSRINPAAAIAYWSSTEATIDGVLGGFPQVSRIDLQGSSNFFAKLRRGSKQLAPGQKLDRVCDCGAGIGRITDGFLSKIADVVDIVEPVKSFTNQIKADNVGRIFNLGIEDWDPQAERCGPYDLIWIQWCLSQITDLQTISFLQRLVLVLRVGGHIVVKENISSHPAGSDIFDEVDSSVTRTDIKLRQLFAKSGLKIVATELQRGFPQACCGAGVV